MSELSRKGKIIAVANQITAMMVKEAEGRPRTLNNLLRINAICQALVQRPTPIRPTAKSVSEEGQNRHKGFPAPQTIFNVYPEILQTWRRAFDDILNIDAPNPIGLDEIDKIDPSYFESGSRAVIETLVCQVREVTRRNNALKQLISESVPTPADNLPPSADGVMMPLAAWLSRISDSSFERTDFGLMVTAKSRPGTIIIEGELLDELGTLVADYELARKSRDARHKG